MLEAQLYNKSLNGIVLKSASELDYPPYSIVSKNGEADGFSVELLHKSVEAMGGKIEFKVDSWVAIKEKLKNSKIDVLPVMERTDERLKYYDLTTPYITLHGSVFTRSDDSRIKTYEDLKDKVIVVMKGDNAEDYVREKNIGKEIVTFDTYALAFKALSSGKYDAIVVQKLLEGRLSVKNSEEGACFSVILPKHLNDSAKGEESK
jgi:ABC-type amino acid transport substrate-binding protein